MPSSGAIKENSALFSEDVSSPWYPTPTLFHDHAVQYSVYSYALYSWDGAVTSWVEAGHETRTVLDIFHSSTFTKTLLKTAFSSYFPYFTPDTDYRVPHRVLVASISPRPRCDQGWWGQGWWGPTGGSHCLTLPGPGPAPQPPVAGLWLRPSQAITLPRPGLAHSLAGAASYN